MTSAVCRKARRLTADAIHPIRADYWVLWVDDGYNTAVVGVPNGRAGWILARTPQISPHKRAEAENRLRAAGYDVGALIDTPQTRAE